MERDLDFYLPRTAHGSSLSPAVHASVLDRAGRSDEALELLRVALRIDLDDSTGTTAGGLHLAAMDGAWQAVVFGCLGLSIDSRHRVRVDPILPSAWDELRVRCRVRGRHVEVWAGHDEVTVSGARSLPGAATTLGHVPRFLIEHASGLVVVATGPPRGHARPRSASRAHRE